MSAARAPSRDLLAVTVRFCRLLRSRGLAVTLAGSRDALRALEVVDLADPDEVRHAFRAVLVSRREELPMFDAAFDAFWPALASPPGAGRVETDGGPPDPQAHFPRASKADLAFHGWTQAEERVGKPVGLPGLSDIEATVRKDFSTFGAEELEEVLRLAARLARRLATQRSRRFAPARCRGRVDPRRTLRWSVTRGEPVELARRERKLLKTKLVLLCDVSGSMDLYSRLLIQFLYALQNRLGRMETFVFSTRLERVTESLRGRPFAPVLSSLGDIRGWSGGTRIGESLSAFYGGWRALLDRDTVVVVLSDGWDTGDPAILGEALEEIGHRSRKIVWLNPLLGSPGYQPLAQGMAAALPHVDAFLPAHDLASLQALVDHLRF